MGLNIYLVVFAFIIFSCIFLNKVSNRLGVPVLLLFIALGFFVGWNEVFNMEAYRVVERICTIALIFIMFYGGFGTKWKTARPVAVESGLLATFGVFITAGLTGLFCHYGLHWGWAESFLLGSVISSTDAATVFSILRTKKMGLRNNTAPILEVESGSNDPCSNILTLLMLSVINGTASGGGVVWMIFSQFFFGTLFGLFISTAAVFILKRRNLGTYTVLFMFAVALISYGLPSVVGGNGYLSAYIVGIVLGNTEFKGRKPMVNFFDGLTSLMQIIIFFLLGVMAIPSNLKGSILPALMIFLFITLISRPVAVTSILAPFNIFKKVKYSPGQIGLVSFVGLRGAASIVFSTIVVTRGTVLDNDIFGIVFCIVLISMAVQGSLIPFAARITGMTDSSQDVMRTFNDFKESSDVVFSTVEVKEGDAWNSMAIKEMPLPQEVMVTLVIRKGQHLVPRGNLKFQTGDKVILCGKSYSNATDSSLIEHTLRKGSAWDGKMIRDFPPKDGLLVILVRRGDEKIIPRGNTVVHSGDTLVILDKRKFKSQTSKELLA